VIPAVFDHCCYEARCQLFRVGKSTFLKILAGKLQLSAGTVRLGETVRLGYYEQSGLELDPKQEDLTVLRFVQEAVQKGSSGPGLKEPVTQMLVEPGAALGRRKLQSGKEPGVSVQVSNGPPAGGAATVAFSEREAMALLNRFQFPPRRWQDRVSRLSGGERRRLQLLQVLARAPNVLLLDEPSNDLGTRDFITCILAFLTQPLCADPRLGHAHRAGGVSVRGVSGVPGARLSRQLLREPRSRAFICVRGRRRCARLPRQL
jgi:energy-coupling factor transporter ATP-binding protein EcfA2